MKGTTEDMNLDYFRAEYIGRNIGAPVEFIAYENRPLWNFENAVAIAVIHGILPRPNDLGYPLELMSRIWRIMDAFPIEKSDWMPYWRNTVKTSDEKIKVSYYRYTDLTGDIRLLAFAVNISSAPIDPVSLDFGMKVSSVTDLLRGETVGDHFSVDGYGFRILYVK